MTTGRNRVLASVAAVLLGSGLAIQLASPATADPDLKTVKKRVEALYHQAEQASERYNQARDDRAVATTKLKALRADVRRQQAVVSTMRGQVASMVVEQYQGGGLSTASQVVLSEDPEAFIDNLNAVSSYNDQRGQVISQFEVELKRLNLREDAADDQAAELAKTEKQLAAEKAIIDKKAAAAKALLTKLEDEQIAKLAAGEIDPADVSVSGRAGVAVKFALAQVGKAYIWGAEGPNGYDCSGLTKAAWGRAGVGLPHSSRAQMGSGARVPSSALKPGDLVFYYSPVSHVGIYIGGGQIVHAANPGAGVRVDRVFSMPFSGAVRPG